MITVLFILIAAGALLALVTGTRAVRAWLGFRRARTAFQDEVAAEVERLAGRAGETEVRVSALETRSRQLPIRISELQRSLATLKILTGVLATSLRQAQSVLSVTQLKTSGTANLADILGKRWRTWRAR